MLLTIPADATNQKNIPSLLEEMGYPIPCNCFGAHRCNGTRYPFDCSLIPKTSLTIDWEPEQHDIHGLSLESFSLSNGIGDTMLIDIGTTTIAFALISHKEKKLYKRSTIENPQRRFGADVIARIHSACQGNSEQLQSVLIQAIKDETRRLCSINHQQEDIITQCYVGGNTTMIHLLLGYDCTPLSQSPFLIRQTTPERYRRQQCEIFIAPWFSAFVGGDICAGLYATRMWETKDTCLFLDLGTNGEIVLSHNGTHYATSTAAGPAFEGGNLSCGCASVPGAISQVIMRQIKPQLKTIDNKLPIGLCGSGAISLLAELLRKGYVTNDGILTEKFPSQGIHLATTVNGTKLLFTADDLRNIQLAIAAIAAGIDTLLQEAGIVSSDVSRIYLGGSFGFHISREDCQTLGLFSSLDYHSLHPIGNSCLQGLFRCATEEIDLSATHDITTINLAESSYFQRQFISHMKFPDCTSGMIN